jgi:hypothetical protein
MPAAHGMGMPHGEPDFPCPCASGEEERAHHGVYPVRGPLCTVGAEAMLMKRSTARDFVLVREGAFDPTGAPLLDTDDLTFDGEVVPRLNVLLHPCCKFDIAFSGFWTDDWQARETVVSEQEISIAVPNVLRDAINAARFTYSSELQSAEVMFQWRVAPGFKLFIGPRWMELDEDFFVEDNFPNLDIFVPSYVIAVENSLVGGQAGAEATFSWSGNLSLDAYLKGGYFENTARHRIEDLAGISTVGPIAAQRTDNSQVVELGLSITCHFNDRVKMWVGYNMMWLSNVATAPSQILGNDVIGPGALVRLGPEGALGVDTNDDLFFHGFNVGLEVTL